jgi:2-dehydropantoate 2-reductase
MPLTLPDPQPLYIVGAGALGSFMAARLALSGQSVCLLGRAAVARVVQQQGLRLQSAQGAQTVHLPARSDMAALQAAATVLVCVKSADTEALARQMSPWLQAETLVLSLQNGVDNGTLLQRHLRQPVAVGQAYTAAALLQPGVVQHHGGHDLVLGLLPERGRAAATAGPRQLLALAERLVAAGFQVRLSDQPLIDLWNKLTVNCACNAISAIAQACYGAMAAEPAIAELQAAVLRECVAVAHAEGVAVDAGALQIAVQRVAVDMAAQRSSTAQDLARGRGTEIDQLNGHIVLRGAAHGLPTPANQALWALVKLMTAVGRIGSGLPQP